VDAIICSAGQGSRMGSMGFFMRKSMFRDIHTDKTILWYQLDALQELGISRVVVLYPRKDWQIPAELERVSERFRDMELRAVPVQTRNILETVEVGLTHVASDHVIRLDGDVCVPERTGLLPLKEVDGNAIACFSSPPGYPVSEHTCVVQDRQLRYWHHGMNSFRVWSCIERWTTNDLKRLLEYGRTRGYPLLYQCISDLTMADPPLEWEEIEIPVTYEIDTPEDARELVNFWDRRARELEVRALSFWVAQDAYPRFSVDKQAQLRHDIDIVLDLVKDGQKFLEVGPGEGQLMEAILQQHSPSRYRAVEPNPRWIARLEQKFQGDSRVQCFNGTLEAWNQQCQDTDDCDDIALAMGWAIYIIHDETLHRNLFGLKARKLVIKAAEPPQDRYLRLLVDNYSPEIGGHYIALYRSVSEMCSIVRHAGWLIREVRRSIYPPEIESRYGNRAYLIVAERPL